MRLKVSPWIILADVGPIPGLDNPNELITVPNGYLDSDASTTALAAPTPAEAAEMKQKENKGNNDPLAHLRYIRWLQQRQPRRTDVERYGSGYQDYLQVPLQPLTDNLESMTYEVFEKDPVKYDLYEQAIRKALRDWKDQAKSTSHPQGRVVVAVAGAGRGPLVTRALKASEAEQVDIELWAVEKNPNAYVLLQRHNRDDWSNRVTVVKSDMRSWKGPWREDASLLPYPGTSINTSHDPNHSPPISVPTAGHTPIDILISELLGSFGDNELSPECLDGILHLLAPHGISIPRSYTAFLTPVSAPKLHADISSRTSWDPTAPETPSVVWLYAIDYLSLKESPPDPTSIQSALSSIAPAEPTTATPAAAPNVRPAWSFHHEPLVEAKALPISNAHNARHARLDFRTKHRGVCHGLGGYFESVLYPGVELSTNPNTIEEKSAAMISWFPIFFPLKVSTTIFCQLRSLVAFGEVITELDSQTPLYIPDHSALTVSLWRQTDDRKVWYEWMVESWGWNLMLGGERRKVRLGVSELHTSIKNGCLM